MGVSKCWEFHLLESMVSALKSVVLVVVALWKVAVIWTDVVASETPFVALRNWEFAVGGVS